VSEVAHSSHTWAIETEGLTKSFGYNRALSNVDLKVRKGSQLTIFGPNGAGKTTLIKLLSTLVKPSGGNALVDGLDIRVDPVQVRCRLGVVTHSTFLYDDLTVSENLRFYGKMYRITNLEHRLEEVISQMQLSNCLYDRVGTLSHGMQRRVAITRAVLHNPSVLLLDEPETGLDPHATTMVKEMLDMLNSGDRTIVMTTHNLERGLESADQVAILHKGRIVYQALKKDIDSAGFREIYDRCTS
jgi:ABC-type multidrug transport system ATPase subunit